ncbi:LysM peptidoglycan-binding domain-containing protein [Patescibacteria group bacterium]|nr:LysM peptidoglycan-binding domain-containing protein [Patescibacteria group bacterium]
MPRKASVKNDTVKDSVKKAEGFLSQIKWGESYTSLFLGAVVVIIALILVFSFFKSKTPTTQQTGSTSTQQTQTTTPARPSTYTVKEGDDLWSIAQKLYGSGYNWVDLAKANNLENPGLIFVGTVLKVPDVKPIVVATANQVPSMEAIKGDTYTVVKGDNLWDIAVRAYGDGFKWTEISKANNLTNPDLIFPGNVFKIPR